ncbi:MAG: LptF/LptG family permease [Planctomycetaceae bacterium]|nr:LptF/LptG family permease [Planctomycetaceae bacterium]
MTIFDRYILRSFLKTYCLWFFCLIGIYIVFDFFTKPDSFSRAGGDVVGTFALIVRYYSVQSLPVFDKISPLLCLTAAIITIAMLMRNNELVPILAAGISYLRVIKPIIFAVFFLTLGTAVSRELLLPRFLDVLQKDPAKYSHDSGTGVNAATDYQSRIQIQGDQAYSVEKRISSPTVSLLNPSLTSHGKIISAESAYFQPKTEEHPAGYLLREVQKPKELLGASSLTLDGKTIVFTPKDASWLAENECFVVSQVPFGYLATNETWREYASIGEYITAIRSQSLDLGKDIDSVIHRRVTQPFLDITLLFIGLPIILRRGDRNVFKAFGIVVLLVASFMLVQFVSLFFGRNSDMPVLGAWFPLFLFVPIAVYLYRSIDR